MFFRCQCKDRLWPLPLAGKMCWFSLLSLHRCLSMRPVDQFVRLEHSTESLRYARGVSHTLFCLCCAADMPAVEAHNYRIRSSEW